MARLEQGDYFTQKYPTMLESPFTYRDTDDRCRVCGERGGNHYTDWAHKNNDTARHGYVVSYCTRKPSDRKRTDFRCFNGIDVEVVVDIGL